MTLIVYTLISDYTVGHLSFKTKDEVIEWMLGIQLSRRNLTDFQRNKIALKYEEVIAKRMRERQNTSTGGATPQLLTKWSEAEKPNPTTTRAELAKIAGTSQGSIQRTKYILDNGTPEQIKRAEQGGKGNTINAIANEIKETKNKSNTPPF